MGTKIQIKGRLPGILFITLLHLIPGCISRSRQERSGGNDFEYYVAAYVWPSGHDEERSREVFWKEGIGEWEIIQKGTPRFEGHYQPRLPLWGYEMDEDPVACDPASRTG